MPDVSSPAHRGRLLWGGSSRRWVFRALLLVSVLRLAATVNSGMTFNRGDFYATLPGAHVRDLNPVLWNSPDLALSWGFQRDEYLYGPTQFLTLYPVGLFNSYERIAEFLLVVYGGLLLMAGLVAVRTLRQWGVGPSTRLLIVAASALYFPLLQAYVQREFEIIVVIALTAALWASVSGRQWVAGLVIGYITWFKFFPLVFVAYFVARGWRRAVAGFVVASLAVLLTSHLVFDLRRFMPVVELVNHSTHLTLSLEDTCRDWVGDNLTFASVRSGLCRVGGPANLALLDTLFWTTIVLAAAAFATAFIRMRRTPVVDADERWSRLLEYSVLVAFSGGLFYGHYYYLAQLVIPINVLLCRYATSREHRGVKLGALAAVYILLTAFVVPPTVASRLLGIDAWQFYMQHAVYFYGQALLIGLLLWEYRALSQSRRVVDEEPAGVPAVA